MTSVYNASNYSSDVLNQIVESRNASALAYQTNYKAIAEASNLDTSYFAAGSNLAYGMYTFETDSLEARENELESVDVYTITDLLGEGEFDGLAYKNGSKVVFTNGRNTNAMQAIYLNDTPVVQPNGSLNFNRAFGQFINGKEQQPLMLKHSAMPDYLSFYNSWQTLNIGANIIGMNYGSRTSWTSLADYVKDIVRFSNTEQFFGTFDLKWDDDKSEGYAAGATVSLLEGLEKYAQAPYTHTITNVNVSAIKVQILVNSLSFQSNGGPVSNKFQVAAKIGYEGDTRSIHSGGSIKYFLLDITGLATSPYSKSYIFDLPPAMRGLNRYIKLYGVHHQPGGSNDWRIQRSGQIKDVCEIITTKLNYPNSAMVSMGFDARAFTQPPKRTYHVRMTKVKVPSNYDPELKIYYGNWDGNFNVEKKWTDNPAWIFYDLITNTRYGAGKFGFSDFFVDKWNLYSIGKYCDEQVQTGYVNSIGEYNYSVSKGGVEVKITHQNNLTLSKSEWNDIFPPLSDIMFLKNFDENNNILDISYTRFILHGRTANGAESDNEYIVKISKRPDPSTVFSQFPEVKENYYTAYGNDDPTKITKSPSTYIEELLLTTNPTIIASSEFLQEYTAGFPLDTRSVSGTVSRPVEGDIVPLVEPRFRCNLYLDKQQSAFNALNDIASIFRGIIYYNNGYIFLSNDQRKDAVMLFNNSNVKDGDFVYSGSSYTSRSTVAVVRYNDETDDFKPKVEYLEDPAGLRQYGYKENDVIALGTTSKSQAQRIAKWLLYTNQTETDTVQFTTGQEATYLRPGDVIKIQDNLKTIKRYGGRISDIDYASRTITLDEGINEDIVGQEIIVITPRESSNPTSLNRLAKESTNGLTDSEINRAPQIKTYTIASVSETNKVTISELTDEDFNLIKKGYLWSVVNDSTDYDIHPIEYRVLTVVESNLNEYQVTCMMYNSSKFNAVESRASLQKSQMSKSLINIAKETPQPLAAVNGVNVDISKRRFNPVEESPEFDGRFRVDYPKTYDDTYRQVLMTLDFTNLVNSQLNAITYKNTGGYILEVKKSSGEYIRVTLDGYDTTVATILLGGPNSFSESISFEIYKYGPDKSLENLNL